VFCLLGAVVFARYNEKGVLSIIGSRTPAVESAEE
jgi:hypothetical protein